MRTQVFLLIAASTAVLRVSGVQFQSTEDCQDTLENLYKYYAVEEYFGDEIDQTFEITVYFRMFCDSVGTYGEMEAKLYNIMVTETTVGGNIIAKIMHGSDKTLSAFSDRMKGWFKFVQTEDGSVPAVQHSREEDSEIVNIKKAVVSAFQANFLGTTVKEEADTQSAHKAEYTYMASVQDIAEGTLRMHRKVTSEDVEDYASHIPGDEVELDKEEDIVYKNGLLTHSSGTVKAKLMRKKNESPQDDIQGDSLQAEGKHKRESDETTEADPDDVKTYNPDIKTNRFESKGSYTIDLVGQRSLLRRTRNVKDHVDLQEAVESSILASINHTRRALEKMAETHNELGDIKQALETQHQDTTNPIIAHKIEELVKLEAKYGPLSGFTPTIDRVLDYLKPLLGSSLQRDIKMRFLIYFIISPEGSLRSQMALLECLKKAVNDEEVETVTIYIALLANPQPQLVAELENMISSDPHSGDPLLLAYGGIISRASPDLQQRMTLFLMNRLPEAEINSTSLIHHILALGNTASPRVTSSLIDYLGHPDKDVQLTSILAMRFLMNEPSIQKSLKELLTHSLVTEDHVTMITKSLLYGTERAKMEHQNMPYSSDFVQALVMAVLGTENEELHTALTSYLQEVHTDESLELLRLFKFAETKDFDEKYANATRFRRGSQWDQNNADYNLVESLAQRQSDVRKYQNKLAYIWSKKFGGGDINAQLAAGGFAGVSNAGSYKLFGRAVAKANCYDHSLTIIEFLILRLKEPTYTQSRVYVNIIGITLVNIDQREGASVCGTIEKPLYEGKEYTIFDFTYSIFIVVGTLNFNLKATAQFTAGMYMEFCDNHGSVSVAVGLTPTLTLRVSASGDLEILWVAKGGITVTATFNYQVLPELNTEFCYSGSQIRVKNCAGIYHQWTDNTLELYVWYAWRGWCGWWACTGSDAYRDIKKIDGLSFSWDLPGTDKLTLFKVCDKDFTC